MHQCSTSENRHIFGYVLQPFFVVRTDQYCFCFKIDVFFFLFSYFHVNFAGGISPVLWGVPPRGGWCSPPCRHRRCMTNRVTTRVYYCSKPSYSNTNVFYIFIHEFVSVLGEGGSISTTTLAMTPIIRPNTADMMVSPRSSHPIHPYPSVGEFCNFSTAVYCMLRDAGKARR